MGLDAPGDRSKRKRALDRAYQLRTFEIELYWKRGTYFWAFQIAVFGAFGLIWARHAGSALDEPLAIMLAALGVLTSIANLLSAKGSKFWQENWEQHIDMLEDEFEGRLYKSVWEQNGGVSWSVFRINIALSRFFRIFWLLVFVYVCWRFIGSPKSYVESLISPCVFKWSYVSIVAIAMALGCLYLRIQKTKLHGTHPNQDGSHGTDVARTDLSRCKQIDKKLVRRYAPYEPNKDD